MGTWHILYKFLLRQIGNLKEFKGQMGNYKRTLKSAAWHVRTCKYLAVQSFRICIALWEIGKNRCLLVSAIAEKKVYYFAP